MLTVFKTTTLFNYSGIRFMGSRLMGSYFKDMQGLFGMNTKVRVG